VQLTRLSAALGARVEDVEFGRDDDAFRAALREHHLLLMRGRPVSDDEHLALAGLLGRVASERSGPIGLVSNVRPGGALGSEPASWHADYMLFPAPYEYISLYALELPSRGTQTSFVNGVLAARTLPPELRRRVEGLYGRAVADLAKSRSMSDGISYLAGRSDGVDPHQLRPVLWPHPQTGEPVLAVWHQQTDAILPLPQADSVALLDALFDHLYQPAHQYVHAWEVHDLVIWDNRALQHARPDVGTQEPRSLRRVCVGEDQDLTIFLNPTSVAR